MTYRVVLPFQFRTVDTHELYYQLQQIYDGEENFELVVSFAVLPRDLDINDGR